MDALKKSMVCAVFSNLIVVWFLIFLVLLLTAGEVKSDIRKIILVAAILFMTLLASREWIKYVRQYVDFAIEQKLGQISKNQ